MNIACFIGRLTADPKVSMTPNGVKVCSFSIAVSRSYKNEDGTYPTDFIRCVAWRNTAEFLERYFNKGNYIGVNGSMRSRQYQDKETGKNNTIVELVVSNAYFCSDKPKNVATNNDSFLSEFKVCDDIINDDEGDLPF